MKARKLWINAMAILLLGSWRLANPSRAAATMVDSCGNTICGGMNKCEEAAWECLGCPGYSCLEYYQGCAGSAAIYCFAAS